MLLCPSPCVYVPSSSTSPLLQSFAIILCTTWLLPTLSVVECEYVPALLLAILFDLQQELFQIERWRLGIGLDTRGTLLSN